MNGMLDHFIYGKHIFAANQIALLSAYTYTHTHMVK